MEGVRQKCRPKHQVLVLKCYPQYQKGVQEVKPNSSELSYLLYYVSTRRSKISKVSAFLEKRAARDVWRRKIGNVQVTLQILSALIEKVPRDLPLFARSVLTVIDTVLRSRDISMVEDSISTFETFCRHQDMAALSAEQEFANQYREVVRIYASFADAEQLPQSKIVPSPPQAIRWKQAGLRATKGVVSSEAGLAADGGDSLRIILPVILENLYNGDEDLLTTLELEMQEADKHELDPMVRRRFSAVTVQTIDTAEGDPALASQTTADVDKKAELDMRLLALRCLEQIIVTGSSRGQIRITTKVVLDFILRKARLNNESLSLDTEGNWATSLIELVSKWCPVQARFLISAAAMEFLFGVPPTEESLDKAFTVIYMIDWLLKSPVNMIGLSVIDILLGLMQYISFLVSPDEQSAEKEKIPSGKDVELSLKRRDLLLLLQKCIGDLTTHIYYGDQVVDMIRAILTRIGPVPQEQPSPSALPDQPDISTMGPAVSGEVTPVGFSLASAKVCALKAIKNILLVANSQKPMAAAGVESRNPVGIHVWEATQWLLQEPDKEVRYAYVDTLLYWLKLETSKTDLRIKDRSAKTSIGPKRDLSDGAERLGKRAAGVHQREKAMIAAQSNFLRLLHLTIYEVALQRPTEETEIRILHLLLASLVENLGVNAARFGLPMILRLQDDMATAESLKSTTAKVNIGSFVHGYLWALSENFDLDTYRVGKDILTEIEKRKKRGIWLETISFSLASLDSIIQDNDRQTFNDTAKDTRYLTPFKSGVEELVRRIEESYNHSISSKSRSPPSSPGRNVGLPVIGNVTAVNSQKGDLLPPVVTEQMLSTWSKESCLEAAAREKSAAKSLSGSKTGTQTIRNQAYINGNGASSLSTTTSPTPQGAAGLQNSRRMSVPESPVNSSSRESPVHVHDLKRVLSVGGPDKARRLSPLRGRLDASNGSIHSSSSDSVVSGFSTEFEGDGQDMLDGDDEEIPRTNGGYSHQSSYVIPPVPPIPQELSLPGGLPNDSQRSLSSADRPVTAPASRKQPAINGKSGTANAHKNNKTLKKHKSRSSTGLAGQGDVNGDPATHGKVRDTEDRAQQRDFQKFLDGFLAPADAESGIQPGRTRGSYISRRSVTRGIGRPPY